MPMSAQRMFFRSILPLFVVLCLGILIIPVYPEIFSWLPKNLFHPR